MYITHASMLVGLSSVWLSFQLTYFCIVRQFFGWSILIHKLNSSDDKHFWVLIGVSRGHILDTEPFYQPSDPILQTGATLTMTYDGCMSHDVEIERDGCPSGKRTKGFWPCESNPPELAGHTPGAAVSLLLPRMTVLSFSLSLHPVFLIFFRTCEKPR